MSNIKVHYGLMEESASAMHQIAADMDQKLDILRKHLSTMEWVGDAKAAYQEHQNEWDAAVQELNMLLMTISRKVNQANENYLTTENEVTRKWRH